MEQTHQPVLNRVGQGSRDQQLGLIALGHQGNERLQGAVLPLGKGGLNATARVVDHRHPSGVLLIQPLGGFGEIQLDHLARAAPHQEQGADLGATLQQLRHEAIQLLVGIGQTSEIPLAKDRCAKAGLRKNHHPGGALDQVGAGA